MKKILALFVLLIMASCADDVSYDTNRTTAHKEGRQGILEFDDFDEILPYITAITESEEDDPSGEIALNPLTRSIIELSMK